MQDYPLQIISLTLMVVPLALTVIIAILFAIALWKYCQLALVTEQDGLLHPVRIFRFAALVVAMSIFLSLYSIVLSMWIRHHDRNKSGGIVNSFLDASVIWESAYNLSFSCKCGADCLSFSHISIYYISHLCCTGRSVRRMAFLVGRYQVVRNTRSSRRIRLWIVRSSMSFAGFRLHLWSMSPRQRKSH